MLPINVAITDMKHILCNMVLAVVDEIEESVKRMLSVQRCPHTNDSGFDSLSSICSIGFLYMRRQSRLALKYFDEQTEITINIK